MDVVGGFLLADGTRAKALTGVDDHSRYCVSAHLMVRESAKRVCEGLPTYGAPVRPSVSAQSADPKVPKMSVRA